MSCKGSKWEPEIEWMILVSYECVRAKSEECRFRFNINFGAISTSLINPGNVSPQKSCFDENAYVILK